MPGDRALTLFRMAPTLAALRCSRTPLRHAQLNGKQGAASPHGLANLCCPRNGKSFFRPERFPKTRFAFIATVSYPLAGRPVRRDDDQPGYRPK